MTMLSAIRLIGSLLITCATVGCTALVSGGDPIPVQATDRMVFEKAMQIPRNAPLISQEIDGRHVQIYKVAFDGTGNDRNRIPLGERETIISRIAALIGANDYHPGVGMHDEDIALQDTITGSSIKRTADEAKGKFFCQARKWLHEDPTTEIRIFVTGFSRGAATARHFMNIVSREWNEKFSNIIQPAQGNYSPPRFYALLYDTVATGQQEQLELSLPSTVEYAVHFVAIDEPRSFFFRPTIDIDTDPLPTDEVFFGDGPTPPKRLNSLYLPGAHSDVGTSYPEGVGDLYIVLTEQFLYMMGLTRTNCWDIRHDPFSSGKHDSRGILDQLFGIPHPSSVKHINRRPIPFYMATLSREEKIEAARRLEKLWIANGERMAGTLTSVRITPSASIALRRSGMDFEPIASSREVIPTSVQLTKIDNFRRLDFIFAESNAEAKVILRPSVLRRIGVEESVVSLTYLDVGNKSSLAISVDGVLADLMPMEKDSETRLRPDRDLCLTQSDGSSRSPIQIMVIHNDGTVSTPYGQDLK